MNQLKIYKSSAGSGKTFTLVKEYLRLVIERPDEYKHVLAVTFTNKATEEMKSRIVSSLIELAEGRNEELKGMLAKEIAVADIKTNAQTALDFILHDYSNFSVCTIDSFFNRIVRALAREIQLPLRLDVQLNADEVIEEITSQLLSEVGDDNELAEWLSEFLMQKLRDDKGWGVDGEIASIAKELFKEKSIDQHSHSREEIRKFFVKLKEIKARFENAMKDFGSDAMTIIAQNNLSAEDFSYKSKGVIGYFEKLRKKSGAESYLPNSYVLAANESPDNWCSKSSKRKEIILPLVKESLLPLLRSVMGFYEKEFPRYVGAMEVLKRIYLLGIVEDIRKKLQQYRSENNLLLISDTPKILSEVISAEEAPFVYEKAGSRYHHFLIDEFQDTSDLQWKNLLPLIVNSLADGNFSMVVGDVKQSIYRWRSGNMNLLAQELKNDLRPFHSIIKVENLDTNYRSKKEIVDFNNLFFNNVPGVIDNKLELGNQYLLDDSYSEAAIQRVAEKNAGGGYVEIQFIAEGEGTEGDSGWEDKAKEKLSSAILDKLSSGYKLGDMAVLVRNNTEGDDLATFLIGRGIPKVISPESLLLNRSSKVSFLINVMRYLVDRQNRIAQADIMFSFAQMQANSSVGLHSILSEVADVTRSDSKQEKSSTLFESKSFDDRIFNKLFPEEFISRLRQLSKLPVYELCEQIIQIFNIYKPDTYIHRFLDLILEYSSRHDSSVNSFISWWDESPSAQNTAVITPESDDALRIMTIHRSKGLQFPIVFIPFAGWRLMPDVRDVMWVNSDVSPFSEFGKIPVNASKLLMNSCFSPAYESETLMSIIDNINLLYVAFTRAEDQLHIYCPVNTTENLNTTDKLIREVINTNARWAAQLNEESTLVLGETNGMERKMKKREHENTTMQSFPLLKWEEVIRLSTHTDELMEILDQPAARAINYGVLIHKVLSSINAYSEIRRGVENVFFEGLINADEKEGLEKEIREMFEVKQISSFFSEEWSVMAEREMILPSGDLLRPDRVLIKGKHALVIDFKTGREKKIHETQLQQYASVLEQMNYESVEKFLIYIQERRVKKVE